MIIRIRLLTRRQAMLIFDKTSSLFERLVSNDTIAFLWRLSMFDTILLNSSDNDRWADVCAWLDNIHMLLFSNIPNAVYSCIGDIQYSANYLNHIDQCQNQTVEIERTTSYNIHIRMSILSDWTWFILPGRYFRYCWQRHGRKQMIIYI
jgi:hypothetical protein